MSKIIFTRQRSTPPFTDMKPTKKREQKEQGTTYKNKAYSNHDNNQFYILIRQQNINGKIQPSTMKNNTQDDQ